MPYIITEGIQTTDSGTTTSDGVACATLDDARRTVADIIGRANEVAEGLPSRGTYTPTERAMADEAIDKDGGSVNLVDDRVIDVTPVRWTDLWRLAGSPILPDNGSPASDQTLDAYNEGSR